LLTALALPANVVASAQPNAKRHRAKQNIHQPLINPTSQQHSQAKTNRAQHHHGTRANSRRHQTAANATQATTAPIVRIEKGMYGLPQAGIIANERLTKFLEPQGYTPCSITPGLWKHKTRSIQFSLVFDDFGIKYTDKANVHHLIAALSKDYVLKVDWAGTKYCGLSFAWDYANHTVDISMPGYIDRALQRFAHPTPTKPQPLPHAWARPHYGAKQQFAPADDITAELPAADKTRIQEIIGVLLFYGRAVGSTLIAALGTIATQQSAPTAKIMDAVVQILDYCATNPEATVRFHASDMILHIDSDASYLSAPKACSRAAGYHYLSSYPKDPTKAPDPTDPSPKNNGAIHVMCNIMREVLASAAEAELAALFHNGREACQLRITLEELGHPQPPTPIATDNTTASGITNDTVKQKQTKQSTCNFTGFKTVDGKASLSSTGKKAVSTKLIISRSITTMPTIRRYVPPIFSQKKIPPTKIIWNASKILNQPLSQRLLISLLQSPLTIAVKVC
jgi:hypothetical protein